MSPPAFFQVRGVTTRVDQTSGEVFFFIPDLGKVNTSFQQRALENDGKAGGKPDLWLSSAEAVGAMAGSPYPDDRLYYGRLYAELVSDAAVVQRNRTRLSDTRRMIAGMLEGALKDQADEIFTQPFVVGFLHRARSLAQDVGDKQLLDAITTSLDGVDDARSNKTRRALLYAAYGAAVAA
jgi:hypothetical protein